VRQSGTAVATTVTYDEPTRKVILRPAANLAARTVYTATIKGGAAGVKDPAGNALAGNRTWTCTTR
jgi:Bacterial Ig-like domain